MTFMILIIYQNNVISKKDIELDGLKHMKYELSIEISELKDKNSKLQNENHNLRNELNIISKKFDKSLFSNNQYNKTNIMSFLMTNIPNIDLNQFAFLLRNDINGAVNYYGKIFN